MLSTAAYSELLSTLYDAPLNEAQWQVFLSQLCEATRSSIGFFLGNDSALGHRMLTSGGSPIPAQVNQGYKLAYTYADPFRQAYMRNPQIGLFEGEDILPHQELIKTEVYREFIGPFGLAHMTCVVLSISPRSHELVSLWRGPNRPHMEPDCKELLTMLIPHMQNALKIRQTLGRAENRARTSEAVLDTNETASILLDGTGHILHMNQPAQTLALASDGICVRSNRVTPTDPSRRSEFNILIAECTAADLRHPGGALALSRPSRKRPLQILITPLRLPGPHRSAVRVLVLATDPERSVHFPDAVLRQMYALTPAETEVANGLLTGFSVEEIARLRRVSVATVRSQMKSLLGKTATQRQGDLIRLLATLPRTAPAALLQELDR